MRARERARVSQIEPLWARLSQSELQNEQEQQWQSEPEIEPEWAGEECFVIKRWNTILFVALLAQKNEKNV